MRWDGKSFRITILLICAFAIFAHGHALAASYYVAPRSEVPVRRAPGSQYKIIAILKDGAKVDMLEDDGTWARILLRNGKEGWILRRYITDQPPLSMVVASQKEKIGLLSKEKSELEAKFQESEKKRTKCEKSLKACIEQRDNIHGDYQALMTDAADVIELKRALNESTTELNKLKQDLATLQQENLHLKNSERVKWFLAGGCVLLIGWLLGMVMARSRRRRRPTLL